MTNNHSSEQTKHPHNFARFLFFPAAALYHELLICYSAGTGTLTLLPISLFSLAAGSAAMLLLDLFRNRTLARTLAVLLCTVWAVYVCIEYCCRSYFKLFFSVSYIISMSSSVATGFGGEIEEIIAAQLPIILAALLPLIILLIFSRHILPEEQLGHRHRIAALLLFLLFQTGGSLMGFFGARRAQYTYDYNANDTIAHFGITAATRLELEYTLFGIPKAPLPVVPDDINTTDHPEITFYNTNELDIPFRTLLEQTQDRELAAMHRYFSSRAATAQNEYTGLFQGKNLILITAEAFSPYVISEALTPTLYRLSHEGFVFDNYYQPAWGQSTTGGEFAVMTGLLPTWVNNTVSFYATRNNAMPFALGNQFRKLGYTTLAYHNNTYNYYDRDQTHPNLGYDYYGLGNGLTGIDTSISGPFSDLEMMRSTVDGYLQDYLQNGKPFHTYYMTFSGHANWGWGHSMAKKNREAVQTAYPDMPSTLQAYIAANLELEYALQYLMERLEETGAADDTVICMSSDHYPYALLEDNRDYYQELSGNTATENETERYRSTLILWCGSMKKPIKVAVPCTAIDILPTLSNLFGLPYDSRLLSGRDVFAPYSLTAVSSSMPLAVLPVTSGKSWSTPAGTYESSTNTFTANPGVTVMPRYATQVNTIVDTKYNYAKALVQNDYYRIILGD